MVNKKGTTMSFRLSAAQISMQKEFVDILNNVENQLKLAITKYNEGVEPLRDAVVSALSEYNEAVQTVKQFCDDVASEADDAIIEKGEKWQNSDKGESVIAWKQEWEEADFEELEIDFPEDLDVELPDNGTTLSVLPREP
jgi:phage/plasmid-associated DNA primase